MNEKSANQMNANKSFFIFAVSISLISLFLFSIVIPIIFAVQEVQLVPFKPKADSKTTFNTLSTQKQPDAFFLAKIPVGDEGKSVYSLLPIARRDIISKKVKYENGDLYSYNSDGSVYAQLVDIKTVEDKSLAESQAKNNLLEIRNKNGDLSEKMYVDDYGRYYRQPYQNDKLVNGIFYDPSNKKTTPVSPDAAEYIFAQDPENGLETLNKFSKVSPDLLSAVNKDGKLVSSKDKTISYSIDNGNFLITRQRAVDWSERISQDGEKETLVNGYPMNSEMAKALEQLYGDDITSFDGTRAVAGDKTIVIEGNSASITKAGNEVEKMELISENGMQKIALQRNSADGVYAEREVIWKDDKGTHKRVESNSDQGVATSADEYITDSKGKQYFLRTDYVDGQPKVSTEYDATGYPTGRIQYDSDGKPIPEQSSKIEYVNKMGKVCDPTRDPLCPYQKVDMRIKVGNKVISDSCKDKNCMTVAECNNDPTCSKVYGETLRAYQKSNFGIALNNAYLAAKSAQFFNVKNFEFTEELFNSQFGLLLQGEPSLGVCGQFSKRTASQEGVLVSESPLKTMVAYVAGEKSTLVYPNKTKEYLYKLNYYVDAQLEDITFNIEMYRGDSAIITLFVQDVKVPKGQKSSIRGQQSIMQYSKNFYDKICLKTNKGTTCNRIVDVSELQNVPETYQSSSSAQSGGYRGF